MLRIAFVDRVNGRETPRAPSRSLTVTSTPTAAGAQIPVPSSGAVILSVDDGDPPALVAIGTSPDPTGLAAVQVVSGIPVTVPGVASGATIAAITGTAGETATGRAVRTAATSAAAANALGVGPGNIPTFQGLNLVTGAFDGVLTVESTLASSTSYRRKMLFSSANIGGGSDTLLRASRPSDGAVLDYLFSASAPGTVLTTGSGAVTPTFASLNINGVVGSFRVLGFQTSGQARWNIYVNNAAESGSNVGSDFVIGRSLDGGGGDNPLTISRSTGATTITSLIALGLSVGSSATIGTTLKLGTYTVSTLPAGSAGMQVYASNGRKIGEAAGGGTGVIAYYSNGNWRRLSDDSPVAA